MMKGFLILPFPGHHRPGLIEANSKKEGERRGLRHFRGIIAPASLKLGVLHFTLRCCKGHFRGIIAPASLKQRDQGRVQDV